MTTLFSFKTARLKFWWLVGLIILLAVFPRFCRLGEVPHGMTWDEAAIGYNGFAIWNTRRDEWLTRLPVSFWSFGDYKAPLAIYLNGIFTAIFGLNLWAVRLPFALSGVVAVLGIILLTKEVFKLVGERDERIEVYSLLVGVLMALSPWHLQFSRIGFESGLALALVIWGLYFFHLGLKVKRGWADLSWFLLSTLSLVASVYAYHSAKIVVPLLALWLVVWHRRTLYKKWQVVTLAGLTGGLTLWPLVKDALFGQGLARAGTLIFSQGYGWWETLVVAVNQFMVHLSPAFLIFGQTDTLRHGDGQWGVLLPTTLLLILFGLWFVIKQVGQRTYPFWLAIGLVFIGLLPAALGTEVPHPNRALLALPGFILLAVLGWRAINSSKFSVVAMRSLIGTFILLHGLFFISYLNHYYTQYSADSTEAFQDGYLDAFAFALPYERGEAGRSEVDKIIFTSDYGQPYIYALFARQTNPLEYHGGSLIKYEFKDEIVIGDLERPNTLVVASNTDELLGRNDQADQVIYGADKSVRFRIYLNQ